MARADGTDARAGHRTRRATAAGGGDALCTSGDASGSTPEYVGPAACAAGDVARRTHAAATDDASVVVVVVVALATRVASAAAAARPRDEQLALEDGATRRGLMTRAARPGTTLVVVADVAAIVAARAL